MLGYIALIAATVANYRIAEMDGEKAIIWGGLTLIVGVGLSFLMPGFLAAFLALIIGFMAMFINKARS